MIHMQIWQPQDSTACVIQVLHGLGEHAGRYARFAAAANARDFAVCVHDHRGHGGHGDEPGHFSDDDGWHKVNTDAELVNDFIRSEYDNVPIVMLGHSMGSYLAQSFAMHYGARLSGLILSASTWPSRLQLGPAKVLAHVEAWRLGKHGHSKLLDGLGFDGFNKRFEPARTGVDWLSRDVAEVDKYVADSLCGGPYSCGLWIDLIEGLFTISSENALGRISPDLPILITGGSDDPVGGEHGMSRLAMHYAQTCHQRLQVKVYPEGRHEMLNDINRDDVTSDWLDWVSATTRTSHSG